MPALDVCRPACVAVHTCRMHAWTGEGVEWSAHSYQTAADTAGAGQAACPHAWQPWHEAKGHDPDTPPAAHNLIRH
eukprot:251144-Chlamydomonas_euryale.AAC.1